VLGSQKRNGPTREPKGGNSDKREGRVGQPEFFSFSQHKTLKTLFFRKRKRPWRAWLPAVSLSLSLSLSLFLALLPLPLLSLSALVSETKLTLHRDGRASFIPRIHSANCRLVTSPFSFRLQFSRKKSPKRTRC